MNLAVCNTHVAHKVHWLGLWGRHWECLHTEKPLFQASAKFLWSAPVIQHQHVFPCGRVHHVVFLSPASIACKTLKTATRIKYIWSWLLVHQHQHGFINKLISSRLSNLRLKWETFEIGQVLKMDCTKLWRLLQKRSWQATLLHQDALGIGRHILCRESSQHPWTFVSQTGQLNSRIDMSGLLP